MPKRQACSPQVIFTADDFGGCSEINRAALRAHEEGTLTSASLMIGAPGAGEAVEIARRTPTLAVGLHLVLSEGIPVLPRDEVSRLVNARGELTASPLVAGLKFLSPRTRKQLRRELRAQFERFAQTGLPLSHVDGHMHLHIHPFILPDVIALAREFGAAGIRVPHEPALPALRAHGFRAAGRALVLSAVSRWQRKLITDSGLRTTAAVFGIAASGAFHVENLLDMLENLNLPSAEFIFHPIDAARSNRLGPNPEDFQVLLDPSIRKLIQHRGLAMTNYPLLNSHPAV